MTILDNLATGGYLYPMSNRRFIDASSGTRCTAVVTLRDKTTADCGRRATVGDLCTQHAKMARAKDEARIAAECFRATMLGGGA